MILEWRVCVLVLVYEGVQSDLAGGAEELGLCFWNGIFGVYFFWDDLWENLAGIDLSIRDVHNTPRSFQPFPRQFPTLGLKFPEQKIIIGR